MIYIEIVSQTQEPPTRFRDLQQQIATTLQPQRYNLIYFNRRLIHDTLEIVFQHICTLTKGNKNLVLIARDLLKDYKEYLLTGDNRPRVTI